MSEERFLQRLRDLLKQVPDPEFTAALETIGRDYLALSQRLNKISHISDGYQEQLRDLNRKLQEANHNLSTALSEVKTLRGLIPICARCKRIRDDDGMWDQIETYISQHSEAVFSHGVCPDCAKVLFPDIRSAQTPTPVETPTGVPSGPVPEEVELQSRLEAVRKDSAFQGHPLLAEVEWLGAKHVRLIRRLAKISRISDGFQRELKDANNALQESSRTDYLTGLSNRRDMMERLKAELSRANRGRLPMTLLMVDVDQFKNVNDTYGHEIGDALLKSIAATIQAALREYDHPSRWGGEEFLVLLPGTDQDDARIVAEKLRERVASLSLKHDGYALSVTVSLGLAGYQRGESLTTLLHRADEAMYGAKHLGRNRVEVAPPMHS
jgi:diguanylate cyclase